MKRKILVTEQQLKYIIDFIGDNDLNEQSTRVGDVRVSGGKTKPKKKKEGEEVSDDTEAEKNITTLFIEKFKNDIGKTSLFKNLPTELKKLMIKSWFNEGGLPEDFFENSDEYSFVIKKMGKPVGDKVIGSFSGKLGEDKIRKIEEIYKTINIDNFNRYNGGVNNYLYFTTNESDKSLKFTKNNDLELSVISLSGYKLFVIAPGIGVGDEAKISKTTTTLGELKEYRIDIPPIPTNFGVESSTITSQNQKTLKDELFNYFNKDEKIQYAIKNNLNFVVTDIKITSSASNTWNGRTLPFTHNNDGSKSNTTYDNTVPNATRNLQLARDRGQSLLNLLKSDEELKNKLKISEETKFNVEGIVTNTNGMTDQQLMSTGSNLNFGQFAKFNFTIEFKEEKPGKETQVAILNNLVVELVKKKSTKSYPFKRWLNFSKAKYLKSGGGFKSASAISRNVGKAFTGFGNFLDSILP
jgi:hypothetical protein